MPDEPKEILVNYNGLMAHVRREQLPGIITDLKDLSRAQRRRVLRNVKLALRQAVSNAANRQLTKDEAQKAANDIAIWFAEQVRKGVHKQYEVDKETLNYLLPLYDAR